MLGRVIRNGDQAPSLRTIVNLCWKKKTGYERLLVTSCVQAAAPYESISRINTDTFGSGVKGLARALLMLARLTHARKTKKNE